MLTIYKPKLEDLWFKETMLADEETMSYNHSYGGTIAFPKERWKVWYDKWFNNDDGTKYYRYLRDDNNNFVGEMAYYLENDKTLVSILIYAKERNKGYGSIALKMICDTAKQNGIKEVYDAIAIDNPSVKLFLNNGFTEVYRDDKIIMVKKLL